MPTDHRRCTAANFLLTDRRKIPWRMSVPQKYRHRKRMQRVDRIVECVDNALKKKGETVAAVERWKAEMPTEAEMEPRDKYTLFDRKAKNYRKGVHSGFLGWKGVGVMGADGVCRGSQVDQSLPASQSSRFLSGLRGWGKVGEGGGCKNVYYGQVGNGEWATGYLHLECVRTWRRTVMTVMLGRLTDTTPPHHDTTMSSVRVRLHSATAPDKLLDNPHLPKVLSISAYFMRYCSEVAECIQPSTTCQKNLRPVETTRC